MQMILQKLNHIDGRLEKLQEEVHRSDKALAVFQAKVYTFAGMVAAIVAAGWDWIRAVFF